MSSLDRQYVCWFSSNVRQIYFHIFLAILESPRLLKTLAHNFEQIAPICFLYSANSPRSQNISMELKNAYFGRESLEYAGTLQPMVEVCSIEVR